MPCRSKIIWPWLTCLAKHAQTWLLCKYCSQSNHQPLWPPAYRSCWCMLSHGNGLFVSVCSVLLLSMLSLCVPQTTNCVNETQISCMSPHNQTIQQRNLIRWINTPRSGGHFEGAHTSEDYRIVTKSNLDLDLKAHLSSREEITEQRGKPYDLASCPPLCCPLFLSVL